MHIKINGKTEESSVSTVLELLQSKEIEPQMVSVELNSKILDREAYSTTHIQDNDVIEFLFFMGGGTREKGLVTGEWGLGKKGKSPITNPQSQITLIWRLRT